MERLEVSGAVRPLYGSLGVKLLRSMRQRHSNNMLGGLFYFYQGATAPVGQDLLIIEVSRLHSDTSQSVGLLWTSDQPDAETST